MLNLTLNQMFCIRNILAGAECSQVIDDNGTIVDVPDVGEYTKVTSFGEPAYISNLALIKEGVVFTQEEFIPTLQKLFYGKISTEANRVSNLLESMAQRDDNIISCDPFVDINFNGVGYSIVPNYESGSYLYCNGMDGFEFATGGYIEFFSLKDLGKEVDKMIPVSWLRLEGIVPHDALYLNRTVARTVALALGSL